MRDAFVGNALGTGWRHSHLDSDYVIMILYIYIYIYMCMYKYGGSNISIGLARYLQRSSHPMLMDRDQHDPLYLETRTYSPIK